MSKRLQGKIREIRINDFTRKKLRGDLIETFKIINGISNVNRHFSLFHPNGKFTVMADFKTKFINQFDYLQIQ